MKLGNFKIKIIKNKKNVCLSETRQAHFVNQSVYLTTPSEELTSFDFRIINETIKYIVYLKLTILKYY